MSVKVDPVDEPTEIEDRKRFVLWRGGYTHGDRTDLYKSYLVEIESEVDLLDPPTTPRFRLHLPTPQ